MKNKIQSSNSSFCEPPDPLKEKALCLAPAPSNAQLPLMDQSYTSQFTIGNILKQGGDSITMYAATKQIIPIKKPHHL